MDTFKIIVQGVAFLLCITWTYGCRHKYFYEVTLAKATVGITAIWWILLTFSALKLFNPLHLLWSYPVTIFFVNIVFYSPIGLPIRIIERVFLFIITALPTKSDKVRRICIAVLNDLCNIAEEEILSKREDNLESIFKTVVSKYKNINEYQTSEIINESYNNTLPDDKVKLWPLCYYFILEKIKEYDFELTKSIDKTIKKTIDSFLKSWKEKIEIFQS